MTQKHSPPPRAPLFIPQSEENRTYQLHPLWAEFFEQFLGHTVYLGRQNEEGAWRIVRSGDDLSFQRFESGTWTEKGSFTAV